MEAISKARFLRISPMKLRRIANMVRGKAVSEALAILKTMPHKGAKMIYKAVHAARANFHVSNPEENTDHLAITVITVDQGPYYRRMMPRARGRADVIRKPLAHLVVRVGLSEKVEAENKPAPKTPKKTTAAKAQKK